MNNVKTNVYTTLFLDREIQKQYKKNEIVLIDKNNESILISERLGQFTIDFLQKNGITVEINKEMYWKSLHTNEDNIYRIKVKGNIVLVKYGFEGQKPTLTYISDNKEIAKIRYPLIKKKLRDMSININNHTCQPHVESIIDNDCGF